MKGWKGKEKKGKRIKGRVKRPKSEVAPKGNKGQNELVKAIKGKGKEE